MRICGWREDPPRIHPSGTLTAAQKVLQQRWYFSEPLVSSSTRLSDFPVVRTKRQGELMCGRSQKKKPGTEKVLVGMQLWTLCAANRLSLQTHKNPFQNSSNQKNLKTEILKKGRGKRVLRSRCGRAVWRPSPSAVLQRPSHEFTVPSIQHGACWLRQREAIALEQMPVSGLPWQGVTSCPHPQDGSGEVRAMAPELCMSVSLSVCLFEPVRGGAHVQVKTITHGWLRGALRETAAKCDEHEDEERLHRLLCGHWSGLWSSSLLMWNSVLDADVPHLSLAGSLEGTVKWYQHTSTYS